VTRTGHGHGGVRRRTPVGSPPGRDRRSDGGERNRPRAYSASPARSVRPRRFIGGGRFWRRSILGDESVISFTRNLAGVRRAEEAEDG
jgi:hypothetical protein